MYFGFFKEKSENCKLYKSRVNNRWAQGFSKMRVVKKLQNLSFFTPNFFKHFIGFKLHTLRIYSLKMPFPKLNWMQKTSRSFWPNRLHHPCEVVCGIGIGQLDQANIDFCLKYTGKLSFKDSSHYTIEGPESGKIQGVPDFGGNSLTHRWCHPDYREAFHNWCSEQ